MDSLLKLFDELKEHLIHHLEQLRTYMLAECSILCIATCGESVYLCQAADLVERDDHDRIHSEACYAIVSSRPPATN